MKGSEPQERLLVALAEQLKLPLMQIARSAELGSSGMSYTDISHTADMALRLIDSYILSISTQQSELSLEPIAVSSVLHDTAHRLATLAKQHDCNVQVRLSGKYPPVMANRQYLAAAIELLGASFIESQNDETSSRTIVLGAHKSAQGVVTGIFSSQHQINNDVLRRARALYGNTRQPLASVLSSSGAGVFIADSLMQAMSTNLRVSHHEKLSGLAATLFPSQQMRLGGIV